MSRLAEMQARFQQRQMQEKEEKLLRLYENQQQRAFDKVSRGSSGGSNVSGGTSPVGLGATLGATGAGRVRQMFDERRQKAGIDRSYPLEPLKQTTRLNGHATANRVSSLDRTMKNPSTRNSTMTVKSTVQRTVSQSTNGKPLKSRTVKQSNHASYANGKLVEENSSFEEQNDNDPINILKQQQRDLEMMMNNQNLNDSLECLDDEELPNVEVDEVDEGTNDLSPSPNENDYIERKSNGNHGHEISSTGSTPTRSTPTRSTPTRSSPTRSTPPRNISNNNRPSPATKKTVSKTTSITKTASPRSSAEDKKRPSAMKSASSRIPPRQTSNATSTGSRGPALARNPVRNPLSATANDSLSPCKFCQRRFAPDRLTKHEEICAKTAKKKRKVYDAVKHRVEGTDVEGYAKKGPRGTTVKVSKPPTMPKTDWRRQHEDFIATIRAAKMAQAHVAAGGKLSDLPPPPPSLNPDYVQCPHCGRRFNAAAAERHIPKCATMLHNKPARSSSQAQKKRF